MMEEWFTGIVAAVLIPAVATVAKALISKALESKTKEVVATDEKGKSETVVVRATAGSAEIRDRLRKAYDFEAEVEEALKRLQDKSSLFRMHSSRQVDFIVELPRGKLALEVKLGLDRIDEKALKAYLTAETDLSHLLLVSRTQPSERLLKRIHNFVNGRQVSMLTIPEGSDPAPLIEQVVRRIASEAGGA